MRMLFWAAPFRGRMKLKLESVWHRYAFCWYDCDICSCLPVSVHACTAPLTINREQVSMGVDWSAWEEIVQMINLG